jgi:hypothetical protein
MGEMIDSTVTDTVSNGSICRKLKSHISFQILTCYNHKYKRYCVLKLFEKKCKIYPLAPSKYAPVKMDKIPIENLAIYPLFLRSNSLKYFMPHTAAINTHVWVRGKPILMPVDRSKEEEKEMRIVRVVKCRGHGDVCIALFWIVTKAFEFQTSKRRD